MTYTETENLDTYTGILRNIKGTYTDLQNRINAAVAASETLILPYNFTYTPEVDYAYKDVAGYFNNGVVISSPTTIVGNGSTISGNNAKRIFYVTDSLTLSDAVLTNGSAQMGGAIYMVYDSELSVMTTTFVNNTAEFGGAIYTNGVRVNIEIADSQFINNTVTDVGGAIVVTGDDDNVTIYGTTFKFNKAEGSMYGSEAGAIFVQDINSLKVEYSEFVSNSADAAGAISINSYGDPAFETVITNTNFINNTANDGSGGAIWSNIILTIENSKFENNTATTAGALYVKGTTTVKETEFISNEATGNGGAIFFHGGNNTLTISDNTNFTDNKAGKTGGAILISTGNATITANFNENTAVNSGGAIHARDGSVIEIIGSEFTLNKVTGSADAPSGGAVYIGDAKANITDSTFTDNEGTTSAGAVYIGADNAIIKNTQFINNKAGASAGALWVNGYDVQVIGSTFTGNEARDAGGAVVWATKNGILADSTFDGNNASQGGAVYWIAINGTIIDSDFSNNNATQNGGAVFWLGKNGTIEDNCVFTNNKAGEHGNAIYWNGANGVVYGSEFISNTGGAGAIIWLGANGLINASYFYDNGDNRAVFNIYKLAEDLTISNNTFVVDTATIKTDKALYYYGENVTVSGEFYWGVNDYPINLTVALDKGGSYLKDAYAELNGVPFSVILEDLKGGIYNASIGKFQGNDILHFYEFTEAAYGNKYMIKVDAITEFEIEKANATLNVSVGENNIFAYGDNVTVFIELTNNVTGEGISTNITVIINDTARTVEVINGTASFNVTGFEPGQYSVLGQFEDDEYNSPVYSSAVFEVLRPDRNLTIEVEDIIFGEVAVINITVTDYRGIQEKGTVILNISGEEIVVIVDGNKSVVIAGLPVGEYTINATLAAEGLDAAVVNDTESFTVGKAASNIAINGTEAITTVENATVTVTVGPEGVTGTVNITVDGEAYGEPVAIVDGVVTLVISGLTAGTYNITAQYNGDESFNASGIVEMKVVVSLAPTSMEIVTEDAVYNETAYVIVSGLPEDANGTVTVTIGDKTFTAEVIDGNATVEITGLAAGKYESVDVAYSGNNKYNASSDTTTIVISPANSTVEINPISDVIYNASVEVTYTIDNKTDVSIKVFDANGDEVTEGVNTTVDGTVTISGLDAGKYTIVISNAGDGNHTSSNATAEFIVNKATVTIEPNATGEFVVGGEVNVTFTVPADIDDGALTVTIDGVEVTGFTIGNGTITIPGTYAAGPHIFTVTLTGDTNYEDATGSTTFDIDKVHPIITFSNITGNVGETVEVNVTIEGGDATGYIYFDGDLFLVKDGQTTIFVDIKLAGEQVIMVFYTGDDKYYNESGAKVFDAGKAASTIAINGTEAITTVENATVTVTVGPEGVTGTVNITVDGEAYGEPVEVIDGVATVVISGLTAGTHTITAQYTGDDNYNASDVIDMEVVVSLAPTSMEIHSFEAVYNETVIVYVHALPEDAKGNVTVTVDGKTFTANVTDGYANVEIPGLGAGRYTLVDVVYSGDDKYNASSGTTTIIVHPANSTVVIDSIDDVIYNASVEVTYAVENETVVSVRVFDADGKEIQADIDTTTPGKVIISGLDAGKYSILIANAEDANHTSSYAKANFTVNKATVTITPEVTGDLFVDSEVNVTFTVPADIDGALTVTIDGEEVIVTIGNGTITIPGTYDAGKHTVIVTLTGDTNYEDATGSITFDIDKVHPIITIDDIVGNVGDTVEVNVTIDGGDATGFIFFNGDYYIVENGQTTISVDIELAGEQVILVYYTGDDKYYNGTGAKDFNAGKAASTIEIDGTEAITTLENATVTVTVGPEGVTDDVIITVDGESKRVELVDGVVTLVIPGLTAGTHNITAQYKGDDNYNASEVAKMQIVVSLTPTSMVIHTFDAVYDETAYVYVHELPEDANGNVTVTVDGKTFTAEVIDGSAEVEITGLAAGRYESVDVTYSGDDIYNATSGTTTIVISPANSTVEIDDIADVVYNASVEVTYTVENETNVSIRVFDADGNEIKDGIDKTTPGKVIISGLDAGKYSILITNAENENYTSSYDEAPFTVNKATVTIEPIATGDFVVDGEVNVTFTVPTDIDGTLTVTIDGVEVTGFDIVDGTVTIPGTYAAGSHIFTVALTGDTNYEDATASTTFDIAKVDPEITIDDIAGNVGETVQVTVTIAGGDATGYIFFDGGLYEVKDGQATIPVYVEHAGMQGIEVFYTGDNKYNNGTGVKGFNAGKAASTIEIDGTESITTVENANVTVTVGPEGVTGTVVISVDGEAYGEPVEVVDGVATVEIPGLTAGTHTITAQYTGDTDYNASDVAEMEIVVSVAPTSMEIVPVDAVYGESAFVEIAGLPEDATGNVTVTVDGKTFTAPVKDGEAIVEITGLASSLYESVDVAYSGDDKYDATSGTTTIEIYPAESTVVIDDIADVVYNASVEVTYTIENETEVSFRVFDADGNEIQADIDTTTPGKVIISGLDAGKYTILITNAEDGNHTSSYAEATFTVNKATVTIEPEATGDFVVDGEVNVTFTVPTDIDGTLTVTIDGVEITGFTVVDGTVTVPGTYSAGDHIFTVALTGDTNYEDATGSTTFGIDKVLPEISFNATDVVAGNDVTITVTLPSDAEGAVSVTVDGVDHYVPIEDGQAIITLSDLPADEYDVVYVFAGDEKYLPTMGEGTFTVSANDTYDIEAQSYPIEVGDYAVVEVTLPEDATGEVTVTVDGETYTAPVKDGKATVIVPCLSAGNYTADVAYSGDDKYAPSNTTVDVEVYKVSDVPIDAEVDPVEVGEDAVVEVTLPEDATGNVIVTVDGKEYTAPVEDGKATVSVPGLGAGDYVADVAYSGDDKYEPVSTTAPISVDKVSDVPIDAEVDPVEVGEDAVVEVTLPEDATGTVTVTVDGKEYSAPVKDGKASVSVPGLGAGNYTADVAYSGDDKYEPVSTTAPISVDKVSDVPMDVSADPVEVGEDAVVEVTLPEDATGNVTVTVDGKEYTAPVENGKATVTVPELPAGEYVADVAYSGDDKYEPASTLAPVSVDKVSDAPINASAEPVDPGETATIEVTLPEDATGTVVADVDGKLYIANVENGTAVIEVPDLSSGNHTATVTYQGDDKYAPVNTTVTIEVADVFEVVAPDVVKYYHGSERFYVYVLLNGEGVADKEVSITINGVSYKRTTDENGSASIALNLNSGNYTVTVKVNDVSVNASITVKSTVFGNDVTKVYRNGTQYYATFYDTDGNLLANKVVTFNINGVFYNRTTDGNGVAKLNINLLPGEYVITAYNPVSGEMASNNITVLTHFVEHDDLDKVYRTPAPYTVTLRTDDGKIAGAGEVVTFNINGVFYNRTTNASGVAKLNINLMPGEYVITAYYKNEAVSNKITVREAKS
jgi:predicted outer membrane repeat protein